MENKPQKIRTHTMLVRNKLDTDWSGKRPGGR